MNRLLILLLLVCGNALHAEHNVYQYFTLSGHNSMDDLKIKVEKMQEYAKTISDEVEILEVEYKEEGEISLTPQKYGLVKAEMHFPYNAIIYIKAEQEDVQCHKLLMSTVF